MEFNLFTEVEFDIQLNLNKLESACSSILAESGIDWLSINAIILDDLEHTDLNVKYLNHNYSTDVLTFDLSDDSNHSGEIYINLLVAKNNAKEYGVSLKEEINRLIVHGCLHLAGFNDETDQERKEMESMEDKYLKRFM